MTTQNNTQLDTNMTLKYAVVTHGDGDGIVGATLVALMHELPLDETTFIFVQPHTVDKVIIPDDHGIFVVDVAINNRNPQMTKDFITRLGKKLIMWYDHHAGWSTSDVGQHGDARFVIKEGTPSCAEVVDPDRKYPELGATADALDTRSPLPPLAQLIDAALKADMANDGTRREAVMYLYFLNSLQKKAQKYESVMAKTMELLATGQVQGKCFVVDTRGQKGYDHTQLMMLGYEKAQFVVVLGENPDGTVSTTVARPTNLNIDLVKLFGLPSGAPFRVSFEGDKVTEVVQKLNELEA